MTASAPPTAVNVLASWGVARLAVLGALTLGALLPIHLTDNLLGWDAVHYRAIAERGYPPHLPSETRFFPLVPLMARTLAVLPGISVAVALLVVANAAALVYAVLLRRLAAEEGFDDAAAGRAVWLMVLAPPAFVLVMGYAESVYGALVVVFMSALRRRSWTLAAVVGLAAGTCRPLAVVLPVVALVEAARGVRGARARELLLRLGPVLGPAVGTGLYLAYIGARTGHPLLPFTIQSQPRLRGTIIGNPVSVSYRLVERALHGHGVQDALHVVWLLGLLALLVVVARTLPASYTVLAGLTLLLGATSGGLNSLERYAWSAFPFVLALARLTSRRWVFLLTVTVSTCLLVGYALLAFSGRYVP